MKKYHNYVSTISKAVFGFLVLSFLGINMLPAQVALNGELYSDGVLRTVETNDVSVNKKYLEVTIPNDATLSQLVLEAKGGDGGNISGRGGSINWNETGSGALIRAKFQVGTNPDQLKPGSTLRFIVGHKGSSGYYAGGGGGASGIAYKELGQDTWEILLIAGGAGGNGYNMDAAQQPSNHPGQNASASTGNPGDGSYIQNGGGSKSYESSITSITGGSVYNANAAITGAAGGIDKSSGGQGFAGGGAGSGKIYHPKKFFIGQGYGGRGGGGGGYTGGKNGGTGGSGSPGTSYLMPSSKVTPTIKTNGSNTTAPTDGHIKYKLS